MKKTSKIFSVILAVLMILTSLSVAAFAVDTTYTVTFEDENAIYDGLQGRTDFIAQNQGYTLGKEYWFTVTNKDGTTTDVKEPTSFTVNKGDYIEFTVTTAYYVEPQTVRVITFGTDDTTADDIFNTDTVGEPNAQYYIQPSSSKTYGILPEKNMTVCLSEFHLYNDCFLPTFVSSNYYTMKRVQENTDEQITYWYDDGNGGYTSSLSYNETKTLIKTDNRRFTDFNYGNTKVVYIGETILFEVSIPTNDAKHTYHLDSYQVYYLKSQRDADGNIIKDSNNNAIQDKVYLKTNEFTNEDTGVTQEAVAPYASYETPTNHVDVYKIENMDSTVKIKVVGVVTYNIGMIGEFIKSMSSGDINFDDLQNIDVDPIVLWFQKLISLITKIIAAFTG